MKLINPDLIRREEAAALARKSVRHVDRLTAEGKFPAPYKFGPCCVLYSKSELLAFLEGQLSSEKASA
ncbi:putative DNA-binding transcriptional regulator AlpA [Skermanella aerolata]|uniref:helix-turn-helix transcriptional regulator n=1 Tax=Skermanella aerolata TaxID=393310 RepID=UPI003D1AD315